MNNIPSVSYTHLDVYKRQPPEVIISDMFIDEIISYDNFIISYISLSSPFLYRLFIFEFN